MSDHFNYGFSSAPTKDISNSGCDSDFTGDEGQGEHEELQGFQRFDPPSDEDYGSGEEWPLASNPSMSVVSTAFEDELVHGRSYHGFQRGTYPLPNDEAERGREENMHTLFTELLNGNFFEAAIGNNPQKIIDIGTGIGIWAIEVADRYPSARVIGTDLSPIQPLWVPPNVRMFVEDCEDAGWTHGSDFDLVHFRHTAIFIKDLEALVRKIFPHIKIGGCIEFHEVLAQFHSDDGSMKEDDPLTQFQDAFGVAMETLGFSNFLLKDLQGMLQRAGFTNIYYTTRKVPVSTWTRDRYLQALGVFMEFIVSDSLDAVGAKPLAALGLSDDERMAMVMAAKESLKDLTVHRYINCCICHGQKLSETNES